MSESPQRDGSVLPQPTVRAGCESSACTSHSLTISYLAVPQDTVKVMLASDNHIGYMERDPVRGQDAINTFQEILQLAVKHDVRIQLISA